MQFLEWSTIPAPTSCGLPGTYKKPHAYPHIPTHTLTYPHITASAHIYRQPKPPASIMKIAITITVVMLSICCSSGECPGWLSQGQKDVARPFVAAWKAWICRRTPLRNIESDNQCCFVILRKALNLCTAEARGLVGKLERAHLDQHICPKTD